MWNQRRSCANPYYPPCRSFGWRIFRSISVNTTSSLQNVTIPAPGQGMLSGRSYKTNLLLEPYEVEVIKGMTGYLISFVATNSEKCSPPHNEAGCIFLCQFRTCHLWLALPPPPYWPKSAPLDVRPIPSRYNPVARFWIRTLLPSIETDHC
jgi:hypothetical protein